MASKKVGALIKQARSGADMTQEQLARKNALNVLKGEEDAATASVLESILGVVQDMLENQ